MQRDSLDRMLNYTLALLQETHEHRDRIRTLEDMLVAANIRVRGFGKKFDVWLVDSLKRAAEASKTKIVYSDGRIVLYPGFDAGKASMKPEFQRTIAKVSDLMRLDQNLQIRIEAYTHDVGEAGTNLRLSEERARAVMIALVRQGIDQKRLTALGLGSSRLIVTNTSTEEEARSDRVELVRR
jgi:flagellar motor protein MotB